MKIKQLFKGIFSYRCEIERHYAWAYTEKQAKTVMYWRMANKHQVSYATVAGMFEGKNNYEITIEMAVSEVDEAVL